MTHAIEPKARLHKALLSAYPTFNDLVQLVNLELDANLHEITSGLNNLSDCVFDLIRWCESRGRLDALVEAATRRNPGNPLLSVVASEWRSGRAPAPRPPEQDGRLAPAKIVTAPPPGIHDPSSLLLALNIAPPPLDSGELEPSTRRGSAIDPDQRVLVRRANEREGEREQAAPIGPAGSRDGSGTLGDADPLKATQPPGPWGAAAYVAIVGVVGVAVAAAWVLWR